MIKQTYGFLFLFDDIFQLVIKILDLKVSVSTLITNLILEKITNNQPLSQIGPVVNDILLIFQHKFQLPRRICFTKNVGRFKDPVLGLRQFLAAESLLKTMKNVFYFMLKALFALKILKLCPDFLFMQENGSIKKIRLISKFTTSQTKNRNTHIFQFLKK